MFGHLPELLIIMVVALIVFGPEKLPEVAGTIGRAMRDVRQAFDDAMHPEEEPVDFDAYYREFEATHGEPEEPDVTEMWPGVAGTESVELAIGEESPAEGSNGAHPVSAPPPVDGHADPKQPAE